MWVGSQKTKLIASKRTQFMPSVRSVPEAQRLASVARRMSALGHVWTAPWQELSNVAAALVGCGHVWTAPWQELSNVAAALLGCGHVSGLFVRRLSRWP